MSIFARALLGVATLLVSILIVLRVAAPTYVVASNTGFLLNAAWAWVMVLALAEWKGLPVGGKYFGVGGGFALCSSVVLTVTTDFLLGLKYFSKGWTLPLGTMFVLFGALVVAGWWQVSLSSVYSSNESLVYDAHL